METARNPQKKTAVKNAVFVLNVKTDGVNSYNSALTS